MSKWHALWKTVRPMNLLIMALTMWGVYGAIIAQLDGLESHHVLFALLTLSIVLLGAGGNIINDIEDVHVDAINTPGKNQIGQVISKNWAMSWYFILTLSGLLAGLIVATLRSDIFIFCVILFIALSLWFYSRWMQKQVLIGNFVVAVLCALLPIIAYLFLDPYLTDHIKSYPLNGIATYFDSILSLNIMRFYAFIAFSATLAREIAKDIEDVKGDVRGGYSSLAARSGIGMARTAVILLLLLTAVVLFLLHPFDPFPDVWTWALLIIIFIPILISLVLTFQLKSSAAAARLSRWLKITMAIGVASTAFFWFL
ncbi:MAG: UbiA family prenyltransferase [Flavobacteriales bacterium]|nr:UbiA family prenyltransferase [Flavobacteriales bacterium]